MKQIYWRLTTAVFLVLTFCVGNATADSKAEEAARKSYERYRSKEYQGKIQSEVERLKTTVFKNQVESFPQTSLSPQRVSGMSDLRDDERLYLFISSSIPKTTIRNYVKDINMLSHSDVTVIMRGFIGGLKKAMPTFEFIKEILLENPDCQTKDCKSFDVDIFIDPPLFTQFEINRVPAIAYVRGAQYMDGRPIRGEPFVVYGDASLLYLLETINRETKSVSIEKLLAKLQKGYFNDQD